MMNLLSVSTISRTRMVKIWGAGVLVALSALAGQAQTVYRIVGPDGKVSFSDKPPAPKDNASATNARGKSLPLGGGVALPYELSQVVNRYPVTLYTTDNCGPCGSGRALLAGRGVPFSERTVTTAEDGEALQRLSGEGTLPFLMIGGQKIKGYSDSEWTQFLDAAGYPKTSVLPPNYRSAPATPLVVAQKPATSTGASATQKAAQPTPQSAETQPGTDTRSNPAGITF